MKERESENGRIERVATVTSEEYGGQGDVSIDDGDDDDNKFEETILDLDLEMTDDTPIRTYADKIEKFVGTCVPVWSIDVDDAYNVEAKRIARDFNMVVCENEMKFA